jgi:hypothetical protein
MARRARACSADSVNWSRRTSNPAHPATRRGLLQRGVLSPPPCRCAIRQGTHAVPEGAGACGFLPSVAGRRKRALSRHFGAQTRIATMSRTAMVRKGSPVRVRQRASETAPQRGFLVFGSARMTTSESFLARRGRAWPLIGAAPRSCASRQRRVLNRRYPRGTRPAGPTVLAARFVHRGGAPVASENCPSRTYRSGTRRC